MSTNTPISFDQLNGEYLNCLNRLYVLLQHEHKVLRERQFEELDACTAEKESLFDSLSQLEQQKLLLESGLGTKECQRQAGVFKKLTSTLVSKCHELHLINASILEISRQFNRRLLDIFLGGNSVENRVYDSDGNSLSATASQVVVKI